MHDLRCYDDSLNFYILRLNFYKVGFFIVNIYIQYSYISTICIICIYIYVCVCVSSILIIISQLSYIYIYHFKLVQRNIQDIFKILMGAHDQLQNHLAGARLKTHSR